ALLLRDDCRLLIRLIEPPQIELPRHAHVLISRPPYTVDGERSLFRREVITHLVTKNSGGEATWAKLVAAQELGVTVVMVERPIYGPALEVKNVGAAIAAVVGG